MMEDVEDGVYEIPDSYFSKATARVSDKRDNGKVGVFTLSNYSDLIGTLGGVLRRLRPSSLVDGARESFVDKHCH